MEAWNITHILYTQRSENSNPRITFYVLNKNDKTITYEMDWYDIPRNEFRLWLYDVIQKDYEAALEFIEWYYCYNYRKSDDEKKLFFKKYGCKVVNFDK